MTTFGEIAARSWLRTCRADDERLSHWWVDARLECESDPDTLFELRVHAAGWMVMFRHGGRFSAVRVADDVYADPPDDNDLLPHIGALEELSGLLRHLEDRHRIVFRRYPVHVESNLR